MNEWMDVRMGGWVHGNGRTDGRTNQWTNECTRFKYHQSGMSHTTYFNTSKVCHPRCVIHH